MTIIIQDVIEQLTKPIKIRESSVDQLVFGELTNEVKGIVVSFVASQYVIQKAIEMEANLIITHEGIFYSHHEKKDYLIRDSVYKEKLRLIKQNEMAIYRLHDYIHMYQPDGIMKGLIKSLEWDEQVIEYKSTSVIVSLPKVTVQRIAEHIKTKLSIRSLRIVGDLEMNCTRIGLLVGYRGGGVNAIPLFENENLDLIIAGEGPEWETPEYVKDAITQGKNKGLIMIGHAASEEPGMELLTKEIHTFFPTIPVNFIQEEHVFDIY